jgi:ABC-type multidrug transport system fused ATPase/permease subunit
MQGRITFVIAHRLSMVRRATRILILDHGRIVEHGTHAELIAAEGLYAGLYREQMDGGGHGDRREGIVGAGERER